MAYTKIVGLLSFLFIQSSCDFLRVTTATNHKHEVQTEKSINNYLSKFNIDDNPVAVLDQSSALDFIKRFPNRPFFNSSGQYLQVSPDSVVGCTTDEYYYFLFDYILKNGGSELIRDSITREYKVTYSNSGESVVKKETFYVHLNVFKPLFKALNGNNFDFTKIRSDYYLIEPFTLAGKSRLGGIIIRDRAKEIEQLNLNSDTKIQLILLNIDRHGWME